VTLSAKRRAFVEEYLRDFNATQAAIRAGYSERSADVQGSRLLGNDSVQERIQQRLAEMKLTTNEVLLRLAEQARGDLGVFFKVSERWTEEPLPTQEIVDEKEAADKDGNPIRLYLVRQVCLDTSKLTDPRYSHLVKKFSDSPKYGLSVELYDAQVALVHIGKAAGMFAGDGNVNVEVNFDLDSWKRQREERRRALDDVEDDECASPDG
jgi:phage terminase small subunit